jgi:hypothetical protein
MARAPMMDKDTMTNFKRRFRPSDAFQIIEKKTSTVTEHHR